MTFADSLSYNIRNLCRGIVTLSAAALLGAASASAQVNAEQVMAIGRNVLSMDDYMLSIQYFNQAIKAKPYLADPYFFRALAKLNLDDYKGAEEDCTAAIERNKFKTEAYKLRGFARQSLGKDSLAILDYNIGLGYNPVDKYFLFYKAVAETELERFDDAEATFSTLLRQYPRFEEGFAARGRYNAMRGDTVAALEDIDRSLELSKSLINSYLMRAEIEWKRREWEKAIGDMDEAIRLRPEQPGLYVNRAFLRYNNDDFFGAMSDYNYALELDPSDAAALFNRALLRYEVKDLERADADFSEVLRLDPLNFHAMYNKGLVNLELGRNRDALVCFNAIAGRYPRFYPVYYAIGETLRNMGDIRGAMQNVHHAEELVRAYVENPDRNTLDRPAIAPAESNRKGEDVAESETEVMERFNQLVTVSDVSETQMSYNEKIKGRVQDRDVHVEPEPLYVISFSPGAMSLRSLSNYFRELDDLNTRKYIDRTFYLNAGMPAESDERRLSELFALAGSLGEKIESGGGRPVDFFARGVVRAMLKDYEGALSDLDRTVEMNGNFAPAYMERAFVKYVMAKAPVVHDGGEDSADAMLGRQGAANAMAAVTADYDAALKLNPKLVYAWFNKGNVYYSLGDYTSAKQCYTEALSIDPEFGQAFFNRGLAYLQMGNKGPAFTDLSKAGELGVLPSYNLLKRMTGRQ